MVDLGIPQRGGILGESLHMNNIVGLRDLLDEYNRINQLERGNRSRETLAKRSKAVNFLLKFDSSLTVPQVTRAHVLKLREWSSEKYKPSSVRRYFVELKALYDYAKRIKLATENPFEGITIRIPHKLPV